MISRYVILLIALGALSCADAPEPAADRRPPAPAPPVVGGSSIRIVSVAGEPGGRGGAWNLGADQDTV
ncbi:MAG TPA: hypothetical protein VM840_03410, partial [Actinomycetota bacterium]|nr:hypothetical protein [Actinomycetota bacterium]